MFWKINGYLAIPHELMHVVAFRLIGKRCAYRLGDNAVQPLEARTLGERIFCLLFPLLVNGLAVLILLGAWFGTYIWLDYPAHPLDYFPVAAWWHRSLFFGWFLLLVYAGASTLDLFIAIRLLLQKLRQQPPDNARADGRKG